jgi:hypothetical protein
MLPCTYAKSCFVRKVHNLCKRSTSSVQDVHIVVQKVHIVVQKVHIHILVIILGNHTWVPELDEHISRPPAEGRREISLTLTKQGIRCDLKAFYLVGVFKL